MIEKLKLQNSILLQGNKVEHIDTLLAKETTLCYPNPQNTWTEGNPMISDDPTPTPSAPSDERPRRAPWWLLPDDQWQFVQRLLAQLGETEPEPRHLMTHIVRVCGSPLPSSFSSRPWRLKPTVGCSSAMARVTARPVACSSSSPADKCPTKLAGVCSLKTLQNVPSPNASHDLRTRMTNPTCHSLYGNSAPRCCGHYWTYPALPAP